MSMHPEKVAELIRTGLPGAHVWGGSVVGVPAATGRMVPVKVRVAAGAAGAGRDPGQRRS